MEEELLVGKESVVGWLIWIQVVIMLLFIILFYHFFVYSMGIDIANYTYNSDANTNTNSGEINTVVSSAGPTSSRIHPLKVTESQSVNNATGTSTSRRRGRKEDILEKGDTSQVTVPEGSYHPCHYLGLARQAFLKCFGLDFSSKDFPNDTRQRKDQ